MVVVVVAAVVLVGVIRSSSSSKGSSSNISCTSGFNVQVAALIVVVLQLTTFLFGFTYLFFSGKSSETLTVCYLPRTTRHTDKVSDWLVNVVEQVAAE